MRNPILNNILTDLNSDDPSRNARINLENKSLYYNDLLELHQAIKDNGTLGYIKWGQPPQGGNASKLVEEIEEKIKENNSNYRYFPTDYIYGLLSAHVYTDSQEGEKIEFKNKSLGEHLQGWEIYKVYNYTDRNSYYSAIYINRKTRQLVLAHRGSEFNKPHELLKKVSDYTEDFRGIFAGAIISQQADTYHATKEALNYAKEKGYSFSVTGHSLGAWLAEQSVFFCHLEFNYREVKAVTFDSPGSLATWKKFQPNVLNAESEYKAKGLDITTYLSAPNIVNCCNRHIGRVYRLFPELKQPELLQKVIKKAELLPFKIGNKIRQGVNGVYSNIGHMLESVILPEFNPETGIPDNYAEVLDWPKIRYIQEAEKRTFKDLISLIKSLLSRFLSQPVSRPTKILSNFINYDHTVFAIADLVSDILKGKIDQSQYWTAYKYIDHEQHLGIKPLQSNQEKFELTYEAHYRARTYNQEKELLYKKLFPNGYLIKLYGLKEELLKDPSISSITKAQIESITCLYTIPKDLDTGIYMRLNGNITIGDLKQRVRRIVEVTPKEELKDKLHKVKTIEPPNRSVITTCIPYSRNRQFVGREDTFRAMEHILQSEQVVAISAFGGVGKSSVAAEYGYRQSARGAGVRWLKAESTEKLASGYRRLAESLGMDILQRTKQEVRNMVNGKLESCGRVILIFDNMEAQTDEYIGTLPSNVKVIITTRDSRLTNDYERIKLEPFSKEQAIGYILKSSKVSEEEAKLLVGAVGNIPLRLSLVANYIRSNPLLRVKDYIEDISRVGFDEVMKRILKGVEDNTASWKLLQYCAYLDPDYIPVSVFKNLFGNNITKLQEVIAPLEELSLIAVTADREGLTIHRNIQEEINRYIGSDSAARLLGEAVDVITGLLPVVTNRPGKEWEEAEKLEPHAVLILKHCTKLGLKSIQIARIAYKLGEYIEEVKCNFKETMFYHKQALGMYKRLYPDQVHPDVAALLNNVGNAYENLGEITKGLEYYQQALRMYKRLYPDQDHPNVAASLNNIGIAYLGLGDAAKGLEYQEQALEMKRRLYPDQDHPNVAASLNNVGNAYDRLGNVSKGLEYQEQALEMKRRLYPDQAHPDVALSLSNIGNTYEKLGNVAKGLEYKEQALGMRRRLYPDQAHPDVADSLNNVGVAYSKLGDENKTLEYSKQAYSIWTKNYNLEHPDSKLIEKNIRILQPDFFTRKAASFTDNLVAGAGLKVGNEYRVIIKNRGEFKEETLEIKLKLQSGILNKIQQLAHDGHWMYKSFFNLIGIYDLGVKDYLEGSHLKKQLGRLGGREENLLMAKMLCFEAMNLGVMKSAKKNYHVVTEFAKAYKELVEKIAVQHPEYFVDGSIVAACIRAFPHDRKWEEHLLINTGVEEGKPCSRSADK